jgi:hypothetical protein
MHFVSQEAAQVEKNLTEYHQLFDKFAGAMHWDGTTDISNVPLENVLLVNPRGPYFHSAVDSKGGNVIIQHAYTCPGI